MAVMIQKIATLARKTFADFAATGSTVSAQQLGKLRELLNNVTSNDLNFDGNLVADQKRDPDTAPVTYIHVWEDTVLSIGMFVLKKGVSIPLHDHPSMYGLVKVIHGTVTLSSFSECDMDRKSVNLPAEIERQLTPSERQGVKLVSKSTALAHEHSDSCVLTPRENNFHDISSVDGPAAFLDILAPPYDHARHSRVCHYYREVTKDSGAMDEQSKYSFLIPVPQPCEFWCDSARYRGPRVFVEEDIF